MSSLGDAIKDLGTGWGSFPSDLLSDTVNLTGSGWPKGTTLRRKNAYRFKVAVVAAMLGMGLGPFTGWWSLGALVLTALKIRSVLRDKK